jgi:hypothetical protein
MDDSQRDAGGAGARRRRDACRRAAGLLGLLGLAALLLACGGRAPAATSPDAEDPSSTPRDAPVTGEGTTPEPGESGSPDATADTVTEAECQALLAHVVSVANAAHVQRVAPEQAPTEEQLAEIRARMTPEFMPLCLSLDRTIVECQMRAQTRDALLACTP